MRHSVDYLYSLYDALVRLNVPNDKARAVVDAMERDMATTIATKADLQLLKEELTSAITTQVSGLRQESNTNVSGLRQEIELVRQDMEIMAATLSTNIIVRTGSMLVVAMGLLFAALKLT